MHLSPTNIQSGFIVTSEIDYCENAAEITCHIAT